MTILDAQGNPVASKRRVGLQIAIIDQKAGVGGAEKAVMGYELDSNAPADITRLLQVIGQNIVRRLHEIGFMDNTPSTVTGGDVSEEGTT